MKTHTPTLALVLSALFAPALGGCASSSAQDAARAPTEARDVNRAGAIASARQDAVRSYGDGWVAAVDAQYRSGFWVVELRAANGAGLRYAISARDGSIRERNTFQ
jgi:hypothetical protein